jgi:succinate-acetate transporter protein
MIVCGEVGVKQTEKKAAILSMSIYVLTWNTKRCIILELTLKTEKNILILVNILCFCYLVTTLLLCSVEDYTNTCLRKVKRYVNILTESDET